LEKWQWVPRVFCFLDVNKLIQNEEAETEALPAGVFVGLCCAMDSNSGNGSSYRANLVADAPDGAKRAPATMRDPADPGRAQALADPPSASSATPASPGHARSVIATSCDERGLRRCRIRSVRQLIAEVAHGRLLGLPLDSRLTLAGARLRAIGASATDSLDIELPFLACYPWSQHQNK